MSCEAMADLADSWRVARGAVEARVNDRLKLLGLKTHFEKWAFIGILRPDDHPDYPEICKKRRGVMDFRLKIDYFEFANSNFQQQQNLIIEALKRSVQKMRELGVEEEDCIALTKMLDEL